MRRIQLKVLKFIAVAASILMLSACGSTAEKDALQTMPQSPKFDMDDPLSVAKATKVQRGESNLATVYKGPNIAGNPRDQLYIRALKSDVGSISYEIYVVINYTGYWRFYNLAYDTYGKNLDLTVMTRNIDECKRIDCVQQELLIVDVTRKYLEENMQSGLRFWVSAKKEKTREVLFIPSGYILAFLSLAGK
jgi:hypothetical protein